LKSEFNENKKNRKTGKNDTFLKSELKRKKRKTK